MVMVKIRILVLLTFISVSFSCSGPSKTDALRSRLNNIISGKKAVVGVGFMDLSTGDTLTINGTTHFPMQSVFKVHLAMAVLDQLEKRGLNLDHHILVGKWELHPDTHSPLRDEFPKGDSLFAIRTIIQYMVSKSDNNACDMLFRFVGGPAPVDRYIHELGIKEVKISADEEAMHKDWGIQYTNWTTPYSALDLLKRIQVQSHLSKINNDFLLTAMTETSTGEKKLKGELPEGTIVAHKTGASGKSEKGITAASNDVGIVTLPDGRQFAIAVFVSDSLETEEENEKIISSMAKAVWDYYQ